MALHRAALIAISIHAPREGRDRRKSGVYHIAGEFQSTRPARGATVSVEDILPDDEISIHAPREGRDL